MSHLIPSDAAAALRPLSAFAVVAGLGWIVDALVLFGAVRMAGVSAFAANILSSLTAAALVYAVSFHAIHSGRDRRFDARLGAYLAYTVALVLGMSLIFDGIVGRLEGPLGLDAALIAGKVAITPPQFLANFLVSRFLATQAWKSR